METINKIIPNTKVELSLFKWYIKNNGANTENTLIFDEKTNKKQPKEIIKQLLILKLIEEYGYSKEKIKINEKIKLGRKSEKVDIIVY